MRTLFVYLAPAYFLLFMAILIFYARKIRNPQPPQFFFKLFSTCMFLAVTEITFSDFDPMKAGYPLPSIFLLLLAGSCANRLYGMATGVTQQSTERD